MSSKTKRKIVEDDVENIEVKKTKTVGTPKNKKKLPDTDQTKSNDKPYKSDKPLGTVQNTMKQTKLSFFKGPKQDDGEWELKDFLFDKEWKSLLAEEFEKDYFKKIQDTVKPGYKKDIVRPPKELVFNALNSTRIKDVRIQNYNNTSYCSLNFDFKTNRFRSVLSLLARIHTMTMTKPMVFPLVYQGE